MREQTNRQHDTKQRSKDISCDNKNYLGNHIQSSYPLAREEYFGLGLSIK